MRSKPRRIGLTSKSLFYAIIIHVAAGVLLVLNIDWPTHVVSSPRSEPAPVQATVVSEAEIQKQMEAIQQKELAEQRKQEEAQEKLEELLKQKEVEEQRLAEIKERQEQDQQKVEELARQKEQEQQELAKLKEQEEEQRKREEAEAERKRQEEAERQRKEEEERKRQQEAEAERKRQEEAERKRKEEEERKRKAAEEQRQKELAEKRAREEELQRQLEQERVARRVESALDQYIPIIRQKVGRNWNRPGGLRDSIEASVNVRLSQTGEVISARIVKSSGNPVFDRSVENAVLKASPLPIPQEQGVNEQFRNMTLNFKPQDMTS